jgi:rhodanese-related sulfurtransferase
LRRILLETVAVGIVSILVALGANAARKDGIPLTADPRALRVGMDVPLIDVAKAQAAFEAGAVFVDARPRAAFLTGHVEGALSIPPENPDAAYRECFDFLPQDDALVVYASAKETGLAGTRATWLLGLGHKGTRVMVDGWEAWSAAGYPSAQGE